MNIYTVGQRVMNAMHLTPDHFEGIFVSLWFLFIIILCLVLIGSDGWSLYD